MKVLQPKPVSKMNLDEYIETVISKEIPENQKWLTPEEYCQSTYGISLEELHEQVIRGECD